MSSQPSPPSGRPQGVRTEREPRPIVVKRHDAVVASSNRALIVHGVLEAPVYYVPVEDVYMEHLTDSDEAAPTDDPFKRRLLSIVASGGGVANAAWRHRETTGETHGLVDHVGFDPAVFNITAG